MPSFDKKYKHLSYSIKKNFILLGSAHNYKEIKIKEKQKVNKIFLSSLFKKNKNFLGLYRFKILENISSNKCIALGGVNKKNIKRIKLTNVTGFAGISFFKKKAPMRGP